MINPLEQTDPATENQNSLQTLSRTLTRSQGEFSLILVRCNYTALREKIVEKLRQQCPIPLRQIILPAAVKTLYTNIEAELGDNRPSALMVFGLETVSAIDQVLTSTNYVREEFKNNFPFPVALWVTDKISKKLIRLVTDIESWTTTVEFSLTPAELFHFQSCSAYRLFSAILDGGAWRLTNSAILGANSASELESTRKDLQNYGISLEPTIEASLKFIWGRQEYANNHIDAALELYQQSLNFWQNAVTKMNGAGEVLPSPFQLPNSLLLTGLSLFHIGLCYRRHAEQQRAGNRAYLTEAKNYLQQSINIFNRVGREDLVAEFINQLGEVLQDLEDWDGLWDLAVKSRRLHQNIGESAQVYLAQDYGFLAQVSLQRKQWQNAKEIAKIALEILTAAIVKETEHELRVKSQHKSLYLLILAMAEYELGKRTIAVQHLETARRESLPIYDPQLYLRVLEMLQQLYFECSHYLEAFNIKQEYRAIEHTYRFRAFIGAGRLEPHQEAINPAMETAPLTVTIADEITVSGREMDLNRLLGRMSSTQHKLTVIYGQSGVGKSSILRAGLVPALKQKAIDSRTVLPLVLQVYQDWSRELIRELSVTKSEINGQPITEVASDFSSGNEILRSNSEENTGKSISNGDIQSVALNDSPFDAAKSTTVEREKILELLQKNADQKKLLTVLVFDQFEEFFSLWKEQSKRQEFFEFLRLCLNIPFVKVVLSVREDYLHHLLEFSRPKSSQNALNNDIMSDILSKDILFYLGNFSPEDAHAVIKKLTERSQFNLEPALIDELVKDLAADLGEVRPIELQVVGAQLQEKEITTLAQYQQLGFNPKQKLVEQFLEEVVKDCGPENERAVRRVLYLLTEENDTRPLKNRAELATDLATFEEDDKLDLVLELLVKSGLLFRWTEVPVELYQLVHDYLVAFIRQQEESKRQHEFAEMQKQNKLNRDQLEKFRKEKELAEAKEKQREAEEKLHKNQKTQLVRALITAVGVGIALSGLSWFALSQAKEAEMAKQDAENARMSALVSGSEVLLLSSKNDPLRVLVASVKLGKESLKTQIEVDTKNKITERLRQVVSGVQESNSFEGHGKGVLGVSFSPDGNIIASASADRTVRLWSKNGQAIGKPLNHSDSVVAVSFSPDGQTIATASAISDETTPTPADKTVKLWRIEDGVEIATFKGKGHTKTVTSVSFSPNGQTIATASYDKTVKLWNKNGILLRTLTGHKDWVLGVSFSPDGKTIASASADKTVKLWNLQGKEIKTFKGHSSGVYSVSFSPDGKTIATASADNTVKLWNLEGKEIKIFKGHNNNVVSVSFSRDGETIVSGSTDDTIKLWNTRTGELLNTFRGHQDDVRSVSFGRDGTIVSGSDDKTVKIWQSESTPLSKILPGHGHWVYSVSFSPDGKTIASGSADQTIKIWRTEGTLLKTILANQGAVSAVSFSPKKDIIAAAGEKKTVKLWNFDGKEIATLKGHDGEVFSVTFSPDGNTIATASEDKTVKLWNREGVVITTLKHGESVNSVVFSPTGKIIASASEDKTVKLWRFDGKNTSLLQTLKHDDSVNGVSFSPDGKVIASVSNDKTLRLWDISGNLLETLKSSDRVIGVSFSGDGKLIATANADNTINLWSFDGRKVTSIKTIQHTARIISLSFSPDSKILAFAGRDKTVTLLPVDNLNLNSIVDRGCDWLQDYLMYNPMVIEEDRNLCQAGEMRSVQ